MRALLPVVAGLAVGLVACGTPSAAGPAGSETAGSVAPTTAAPSPTPTPDANLCSALVGALPLEDQVGQLFMVGKDSLSPVDAAYTQMLTDTRSGQVILLGNTTAGSAQIKTMTDRIRAAAPAPGGVNVLLAVDQEGGQVQRLKGPGFDVIPPATDQGEMTDADLKSNAAAWGGQLKAAGIDVNLAPVADIVPANRVNSNDPVGKLKRNFGLTAEEVTPKVEAVVVGLHEAEIATSLKHFPGLGYVAGNTDFSSNVTDNTVDGNHPNIEVFKAGIAVGSDMVMVSTATYSKIDPDNEGTFSKAVVTELLREELGFEGVIISDDLGAARQVTGIEPGQRALRFLTAGGDVVINGDPRLQPAMVRAVRQQAESDPAFAAEVRAKATRVVVMKARYGAVECTPG